MPFTGTNTQMQLYGCETHLQAHALEVEQRLWNANSNETRGRIYLELGTITTGTLFSNSGDVFGLGFVNGDWIP